MVKKYHTEEERLEAQRQARIKYQQSDKFKLAQKKYSSSKKRKQYIRKYQQSDKFKKYQKEYLKEYSKRPEVRKRTKAYEKTEKRKQYRRKYQKEYFKRPDVLEKRRKLLRNWSRKQRATDVFYRLRSSLTARIWQALKRKEGNKKAPLYSLIGCSKDQLIKHLESKFYTNKETNEPMTWDNYGRGGWEVDHKMPIDSFKDQDITLLETQKKIMHYTNLQPMWGNENKAKSNKILND